ncbi:MAG: hypothetical protein KDK10_16685 [Maritimibacter sp.]|nr:hypothetical protein [Maritimibacter sp.]
MYEYCSPFVTSIVATFALAFLATFFLSEVFAKWFLSGRLLAIAAAVVGTLVLAALALIALIQYIFLEEIFDLPPHSACVDPMAFYLLLSFPVHLGIFLMQFARVFKKDGRKRWNKTARPEVFE